MYTKNAYILEIFDQLDIKEIPFKQRIQQNNNNNNKNFLLKNSKFLYAF